MQPTTNPTRLAAAAALFTAAAALHAPLAAQDVLINEVRADEGGRWIELHNRSAAAVDLSSWSLHLATRTPGMPQNYWWGFPAGTAIEAGGFLRVHWYQQAPQEPSPGDLHTGATVWHFLFGLGGEPLPATAGALGLLRSQLDTMMATPAIVEDWVSWGEHGFQREWLAIANGRWTADQHTAPLAAGTSMARDLALFTASAPHAQQWFVDATPTPLGPNLTGASVTAYGQGCATAGHHLLGVPVLSTPTPPLLGNAQFGLALDHTTGIYGEYTLIAWSSGAAPAGLPSVLPAVAGGCAESIDPWQVLECWILPTQIVTTFVPLSLAAMPQSLVGSELHAQALVFDLMPFAYPPYQGMSNALRIVFGQ